MTAIATSLTKPEDGLGLVNRASLMQLAGVVKTLTRAEFDAAYAAERTRIQNNGAGIYLPDEETKISGEVGSRFWTIGTGATAAAIATASHWRKTTLPGGKTITVAGDTSTVTATTGAPSSGGASGNVQVDVAAGLYYVNTAGVWSAGIPLGTAGTGVTRPTVASLVIPAAAPATLELTFSEPMYRGSTPSVGAFATTKLGVAWNASGFAWNSATKAILTMSTPAFAGETALTTFDEGLGPRLLSLASNMPVAPFSALAATNLSTGASELVLVDDAFSSGGTLNTRIPDLTAEGTVWLSPAGDPAVSNGVTTNNQWFANRVVLPVSAATPKTISATFSRADDGWYFMTFRDDGNRGKDYGGPESNYYAFVINTTAWQFFKVVNGSSPVMVVYGDTNLSPVNTQTTVDFVIDNVLNTLTISVNKTPLAASVALDAFAGQKSIGFGSLGTTTTSRIKVTAAAPTAPSDAIARADARRLVDQAGFGVRPEDVDRVLALGPSGWIDEQMTKDVSDPTTFDARHGILNRSIGGVHVEWFNREAIETASQLKIKATFALQNFFVVNFESARWLAGAQTAYFAKIYTDRAFGNWRDLAYTLSTSAPMGRWLTFAGNAKATATSQPDENYARELMQLFSIGLYELNEDGTRKKSGQLSTTDPRYVAGGTTDVPTYGQDDVRGLARVFTGMSISQQSFYGPWSQDPTQPTQMACYPDYHEMGTKTFLGTTIAANTGPQQSVSMAIDTVFNHPSHPPFFCKQMIQQFVTSNPSPAYVQRMVNVYKNNGQGVRGDLKALWKAILLDPEARDPAVALQPNFGRVRQLLADSLGCLRVLVQYPLPTGTIDMGLHGPTGVGAPWNQPSVFGYQHYDYASSNFVRDLGLVDPEMELIGENSSLSHISDIGTWCVGFTSYVAGVTFSFDDIYALRSDPIALVNKCCEKLNVDMTTARRAQIVRSVFQKAFANPDATSYCPNQYERTVTALGAVATAPERMVQR